MSRTERGSFARRFGATLSVGVPGVLALTAYVYLTTPAAAVPAGLSRPLLAASAAANSLVLLAVACLIGTYAAPRAGLQSFIADRAETGDGVWQRLRPQVRLSVALGVGGGILIVLLDVALAPFVAQDLPQSAVGTTDSALLDVVAYAPVRFLYGGVTEELLLRYGLMSVLAFGGWVLTGRRSSGPGPGAMWVAIAASAVLFGVGHLPALAQSVELTPALVARTVLLNAIAGVLFGWLYWRRSLEAAMVSHAAFHLPLVALSIAAVAAG
jgi:membrane protease YdiL (CAAX protease family)